MKQRFEKTLERVYLKTIILQIVHFPLRQYHSREKIKVTKRMSQVNVTYSHFVL